MLQEHFIASVGTSTKAPDTSVSKDSAIFVYEYQPVAAQRAVLKKSATLKNCLAVSDDHVFAAQANKAVVHVYQREKGKHESTVPFTERITAICLACDDSVLVVGTIEGSVFLWETCTGRQTTTSHVHLQAVTSLAVDATGNFLLSASEDSTVAVWSIPDLLSLTNSGPNPAGHLRTLTGHQSGVTALAVGHSASHVNFAVSAARDQTCLVWDYTRAVVLRKFFLSAEPTCLALDPADRAVYVGYEDGDVQILDLLVSPDGGVPAALQNGRDDTVLVHPTASSKWKLPEDSHGAALSIAVSYDGTTVLSGHESGSILRWDVARRGFGSTQTSNPLPGPVTNLSFLPVTGFHRNAPGHSHIRIPEIVKPRFGAFDGPNSGVIPGNYAFNVQLVDRLPTGEDSTFDQVLAASVFPSDLLDEGLTELASEGRNPPRRHNAPEEPTPDFMALDDTPYNGGKPSLEEENARLKLELEALRRVQMTSFDKIEKLSRERDGLLRRGHKALSNANGTSTNGTSARLDIDDSSEADME